MGQAMALVFFAIIIVLYGWSVLRLARVTLAKSAPIAIIEILAAGLAAYSFLGVIFSIVHIPVHYLSYVVIGILYPSYEAIRGVRWSLGKWDKQEAIYAGVAVVIAVVLGAVFMHGAFSYPWLENDDPWQHASAVAYIGSQHTSLLGEEQRAIGYRPYLEPYPPSYGTLMAPLWQLTGDMMWTLKFFNALIIALGVLFFYLFAREFCPRREYAALATLVFAILPGSMSHFIWSQTLAMALFPVAFYALLRCEEDQSWLWAAIFIVASMMVTQPVVSFIFGVVVIIYLALSALQEWLKVKKLQKMTKTKRLFFASAGGLALSFIYWGYALLKLGFKGTTSTHGGSFLAGEGAWMSAYALPTYSFWNEVINAPLGSRIDQAVGWGIGPSILLVITLVLIFLTAKQSLNIKRHKKYWLLLVWFFILFFAIFLPTWGFTSFGSSRMWAYIAIPLALLIGCGASIMVNAINKKHLLYIMVFLAILVFLTTWEARYTVQTAQWPPGVSWTVPQVEIPAYYEMYQTIPLTSKVLPVCFNANKIIGYGMFAEPWLGSVDSIQRNGVNQSSEEVIQYAKQNRYQYILIDGWCLSRFGVNETQGFINTMQGSVVPELNRDGFLLLRVIA